ncbi:hypothetical protein [Micromonospora endolithica]|uniref:Uncharacterized protein n=1 Tax=Micromonospora endolithica TaxID=230091 RepID=A0A3A9ZU66_9ACTN|nr:hypothetical protein [Micromonospora endolithica]RKN50997.1 hypothetical protein D7223_04490 [Micromonospora endolithica]TWJ20215.1 hypothetical protein JD76_00311 [Micromonospora endolithica]
MAHGEAEHGCAQGEPCRPGHHDQPAGAKHQRRLSGGGPAEPAGGRVPERTDDDCPVPRPRAGDPTVPAEPAADLPTSCLSGLPGWAGAHRHGPVRPRHRAARRERPPRRWC